MVARGIIAKTIEHLRKMGTDRIDIVYVCSNAAIARQNINRLNLLRDRRVELATRLTLLPIELDALNQHRYQGWLAIEPIELVPDGPTTAAFCAGYIKGLVERQG